MQPEIDCCYILEGAPAFPRTPQKVCCIWCASSLAPPTTLSSLHWMPWPPGFLWPFNPYLVRLPVSRRFLYIIYTPLPISTAQLKRIRAKGNNTTVEGPRHHLLSSLHTDTHSPALCSSLLPPATPHQPALFLTLRGENAAQRWVATMGDSASHPPPHPHPPTINPLWHPSRGQGFATSQCRRPTVCKISLSDSHDFQSCCTDCTPCETGRQIGEGGNSAHSLLH